MTNKYNVNSKIKRLALDDNLFLMNPLLYIAKLQEVRKNSLNVIFKTNKTWKLLNILYEYNGNKINKSELARKLNIKRYVFSRSSEWKRTLEDLLNRGLANRILKGRRAYYGISETGKILMDSLISLDVISLLKMIKN